MHHDSPPLDGTRRCAKSYVLNSGFGHCKDTIVLQFPQNTMQPYNRHLPATQPPTNGRILINSIRISG